MYGYTGSYNGKRVSVQGTGMGMPSMHIYAGELMEHYGVKKLIRVGTCGSLKEELKLKEIVIAMGSTTDSNMNCDRFGSISFAPIAVFELLKDAYEEARKRNICATVSNIFLPVINSMMKKVLKKIGCLRLMELQQLIWKRVSYIHLLQNMGHKR